MLKMLFLSILLFYLLPNNNVIDKKEPYVMDISNMNDRLIDTLIIKVSDINWDSIKNEYINSYTSGILSEEQQQKFNLNNPDSFIGIYYFESKIDITNPLTKALVKVDKKPSNWYYSNKEELLEYTFYSNDFNVFQDLIKIGDSKNRIIEQFGNSYNEIDSCLSYVDALGNSICFYLEKDKIKSIQIGVYKLY